MRRQEFTLATRHVTPEAGADTGPLPTLRVEYEGSPTELRAALRGGDDTPLEEPDIDVSHRPKGGFEEGGEGVLAVADRLTGAYVCECNVGTGVVLDFLAAAKRRAAAVDGPPTYRIQFVAEGTPVRTYEMDTFLLYNRDGEVRESESLLPSGAQL
jgi:hypothetical protein